MTIRKLICAAVTLLATLTTKAQDTNKSNFHLGLLYPLSTNGARAEQYTNQVSVHAIAGVSRSERSFCVAGVASIIKDSANGLVASGACNLIGGSARGLVSAGAVNLVRRDVKGLEIAGCLNMAAHVYGMQAAGFGNMAMGNVRGMQAAGFINIAEHANTQVAGFINIAEHVTGMQAAGFINVADTVKGLQAAGFINIAEHVTGTQIAGFINCAKTVKGVQIAGFINIADSSESPIGIINLIKKGEKAIGVTVDESGTTMAAFRSGGKRLYGIAGAGYNFNYNNSLYAIEAGLGAHLPINKHVRLSGELSVTTFADLWRGGYIKSTVKMLPSLRIRRLELFAGPTFNYGITYRGVSPVPIPNVLWTREYRRHTHEIYVGAIAGLQVHL